jgi:hypothetical protein
MVNSSTSSSRLCRNEALALPALKRVTRVETLSRSAKALLPRINAGASTSLERLLVFQQALGIHPLEKKCGPA